MNLALGLGLPFGATGAAVFDPLSVDPFLWFDFADLTTLFQDADHTIPVTIGGQEVQRAFNKATMDNGLVTTVNEPTWEEGGGAAWLEGDGTQFISDPATTQAPSLTVISSWRILAAPGTFAFLWGSENNQMYGLTITPTMLQMTGDNFSNFLQVAVPATNADFVVAQVYNGASSSIQVIGGASASGNADGGNNTLAGMELFNRAGGANIANARCYELIAAPGVLSAATISAAASYLAAKLP